METQEISMKKWIDNASYEALLSKWRSAPVGDPYFIDEIGIYYEDVLSRKRTEVGHDEAVRASKNIGW